MFYYSRVHTVTLQPAVSFLLFRVAPHIYIGHKSTYIRM